MSTSILKIEHLSKTFRSNWLFKPIKAVQDLSLEINRGEAFGFLGHNGAGKTTTIKCIMGLISKTSGKIFYNGEELTSSSQHRTLSYLPEQPYFYEHLTVQETLEFLASLHEIKNPKRREKVDEILHKVGLAHRATSKVRQLSKGLQQRLGLAQALLNDPDLLILDEPFSGLDPVGRLEVRELIMEYKNAGTTIVMSSHILSDVEDVCDRVSIMAHGVLKEVINLDELPDRFGEKYLLTIIGYDRPFEFTSYEAAERALVEAISRGEAVREFTRIRPRLEEIFMQITGRHYTDPDKASTEISEISSINSSIGV